MLQMQSGIFVSSVSDVFTCSDMFVLCYGGDSWASVAYQWFSRAV